MISFESSDYKFSVEHNQFQPWLIYELILKKSSGKNYEVGVQVGIVNILFSVGWHLSFVFIGKFWL